MPQKSRYTLLVDNVSGATPKADIMDEFERCAGAVLAASKESHRRQALVEFKSSGDADYAYRKMHGFRMDGRKWEVHWATRDDFKAFGWRWTEGDDDKYEYNSNSHYAGGGTQGKDRERERDEKSGRSSYSKEPKYGRSPSPARTHSTELYGDM